MIPILSRIFINKVAEFAHFLFKQRGDMRGEAAMSYASSHIAQSLTNWVQGVPFGHCLSTLQYL